MKTVTEENNSPCNESDEGLETTVHPFEHSIIIDLYPGLVESSSINAFLKETEIISPVHCRKPGDDNVIRQEGIRKRLEYYFMNPIEKWEAKGRFPWKLFLQIIKIIFVTLQVSLFGMYNYKFIQQHQDMTIALSHIFLENWGEEVVIYPPSNGPYALYTIPDFYNNVDNIIKQYSKITMLAIGTFRYDSPDGSMTPLNICMKWYEGDDFPSNSTVHLLNRVCEMCLLIPVLYSQEDSKWNEFKIEWFLKKQNFSIDFNTLISINLSFSLRAMFLKSLSKLDFPECYKISLYILYDNAEHDGQLLVNLKVHSVKLNCNVDVQYENSNEKVTHLSRQILNSIVIAVCSISGFLCSRSLHSGQILRFEVSKFFRRQFGVKMSTSEHLNFFNLWYVMIIISDALIICGSIAKMNFEEQWAEDGHYSKCAVLLGVGNLLVWVSLLRYLGFFPKYNMLILTLKRALPNVLRFMVCALFLYAGFCLCGWIVLGPYHIKFQSISSTSECLFSIMNGDDMFATFSLIETKDRLIWWFSRFYLYTFIALFVYVVISLFISVIMDTFETIKSIHIHGSPPKTTVDLFVAYKLSPLVSENLEFHYISDNSFGNN